LPRGASAGWECHTGVRRLCLWTPMERILLPVTERALELAMTAAQAAADKKAQDIVVIDVADQLYITDAFVIASASNDRQVLAVVDAVEEALLNLPEKAKPVRREGERQGPGGAVGDHQSVVA